MMARFAPKLPPMSEIFTEQVTAVGNIVLAAFAIITAVVAGLAWRAQGRQLKGEIAERRREAEERRRAQAVQVYIWQEPPTVTSAVDKPPEATITARVRNTSQQPVYGLEMNWHRWGKDDFGTRSVRVTPLMPGEEDIAVRAVPPGHYAGIYRPR